MSKFLILNADDFGYNSQQNDAIKELLSHKLITSTSVLSVGPEFDDAAGWLFKNNITAGVHLTIVSDSRDNPWRSITGNKSLGNDGCMFADAVDTTIHGRHSTVRSELEAQYHKLISSGVYVDHADNHCGTLYGINMRRFYNDAYDFCVQHRLPYRFPKKPDFIDRQLGRKVPFVVKSLHGMLVRNGIEKGVKLIDDLVSNPWNIDRIGNYENIRKWYLDAVETCTEGVTEMFLHPAYAFDDRITGWTKRVYEYELLKSGDILQKAEDMHVKVISWNEFSEM